MDPVVDALIEAWDWSYVDVEGALRNLDDAKVHVRPSRELISISEQIAHVMRSEGSIICRYLLGQAGPEWADEFYVQAPYGWPPDILLKPVSPKLAALGVGDLKALWMERHQRNLQLARTLELPAKHRFTDEWSGPAPDVQTRLRFAAYHVGYHVGQIYQIRHLLGDSTPDN